MIKLLRAVVLAEAESSAVRTASRALLSAAVAVAIVALHANGVSL